MKKKVLITGTTYGIGRATALHFLNNGFQVHGIDVEPSSIESPGYYHHICDVRAFESLPSINDVSILINNAGTIYEKDAIEVNLVGYINVVEKYAYQDSIKSIVNVASISAHTGIDDVRYCASQGGRISYTKNLAIYFGKKYKATVNSISPGAVMTNLEPWLYDRKDLVEAIANQTLLNKWVEPSEVAELIYFMTVVNKSITGQDILIDSGEFVNFNFIHV